MRWTLGDYTLVYNPSQFSRTWTPQTEVSINANGTASNPNYLYNGQQTFQIDVYEKPTKSFASSMTGSYIGVSEKRMGEDMYLLKNNGTFDIKTKTNTLNSSHTITSGNGVSLPSGYPVSINDWDSGLAFIYSGSGNSTLLITDENGVASRKYIYNRDDSKFISDIAWDYNNNFIALNPYGEIYTIDTSTGVENLLFQFDDYSANLSNSKQRYTSIMMFQKNSNYYMGVLMDSKDIIFIDYYTLDIVCKVETGLTNVLSLSYSNYSGDCFSLLSSKIMQITLDTCRIDVQQIKDKCSAIQITVHDEKGFPCLLTISTLQVTRLANSNEARYQIQIQGNIAYSNVGFGNVWSLNSRG